MSKHQPRGDFAHKVRASLGHAEQSPRPERDTQNGNVKAKKPAWTVPQQHRGVYRNDQPHTKEAHGQDHQQAMNSPLNKHFGDPMAGARAPHHGGLFKRLVPDTEANKNGQRQLHHHDPQSLRDHHDSEHHHQEYKYPPASPLLRAETDPNVLKATMSILATPHSAENTNTALLLIDNVQSACAEDYEQFCSALDSDAAFTSQLGLMFNAFQLMSSSPLQSMFFNIDQAITETPSLQTNAQGGPSDDGGDDAHLITGTTETAGAQDDGGDAVGYDDMPAGFTITVVDIDPGDDGADDRAVNGLSPGASRSEVDGAYEGPNHDYYGEGAIGFGAAGDKCMYQNMEYLSPSCQAAITEASAFRHEYWGEEQSYHDDPMGFWFFLLLFVLGLFVYKKRFSAQGRARRAAVKETNSVMEAIHGNESLKTAVETAYGKSLPPLVNSLPKGPGVCCMFIRVVVWLVLVFMIMGLAGNITGGLLHNMVFKDENGNEHPPPGLLVMFVFLMVAVVLSLFAVLIIRSLRWMLQCCRTHVCGSSSSTDSTSSSSPLMSTRQSVSQAVSRMASYMPSFSPSTVSTGMMSYVSPSVRSNGYAPLSSGELEDPYHTSSSEMTTISTPSSSNVYAQQQSPQVAVQPQYYTGVPVQMPPSNVRYTYGQ